MAGERWMHNVLQNGRIEHGIVNIKGSYNYFVVGGSHNTVTRQASESASGSNTSVPSRRAYEQASDDPPPQQRQAEPLQLRASNGQNAVGSSPNNHTETSLNTMVGSFTVVGCGTRSTHGREQSGIDNVEFRELVLCDTGTEHSWITMDLVQRLHLSWTRDARPPDDIVDFNNHAIECLGVVETYWHPNPGSEPVPITLYIAQNVPFFILFGWEVLFAQRLVTFLPPSVAVPGVRDPKKKAAGPSTGPQDQQRQAIMDHDKNVKWHKEMRQKGYSWDVSKQEYYRMVRNAAGQEVREVPEEMRARRVQFVRPST